MKKLAWSVAALTWLAIFPASAKNLYVDALNGNDAVTYAANDENNPWRTIGRASWGSTNRSSPNAGEAARAGDVVIVRAGTYRTPGTGVRYDPSLNPVNSGSSAGGYIRFEALGRVVLQLSSNNGPVFGANNRSYIEWRGFVVDEANAPYTADTGMVTIFGSNNITIDSNEIIGVPTSVADNHNGIRIEDSNTIRIVNNRIHRITYDPSSGMTTSHNSAGIMLYGSNGVTIEHNEIHDSNSGIFPKGADNYNIVIRRNLIYNCIKGIRTSYSHRTLGQNLVYQNVIRDGSTRAESMAINVAENTNNYTFANNTIDNFANGVYFTNSTNQSNVVFRNNIMTNTNTAFNAYNASTRSYSVGNQNYYAGQQWAHNGVIYYTLGAWQGAVSDTSSSTSNPQYVDASTENFRLNTSSPALNAGVDVLDLDGDGNNTDPINMGAYITGNEQIGRLAGNTLARPSGVRVQRVP